ncbi:uncharacterized protein N7483_004769 [Penicillium malachiteum]|uniref:uncharacterized protein n=1 Tax=Penicillium malachiteum TaxID=1324776 RepID=UPI002546C572|nr:uncharacterized protein N7483_004769 [Penicillium malachiteum]KAJ5730261.1 hypothetical protein N7483_004769 [Penicillium malachiteum]
MLWQNPRQIAITPPPGAPLIESTRPHEDSMEDFDPQATRKRPRLDSGSRVGESLSIDACATPSAPASEMDVTPDSARSSKKHPKIHPNFLLPPHNPPTPTPNLDNPESTTPSKPISLSSSSPSQSPEIQVAELEDMDQDPNTSNWKPLQGAVRDQVAEDVIEVKDTSPLVDGFPKFRDDLSARDNLQKIIMMVEQHNSREAKVLSVLKVWFDDCARNTDRLTPEAFMEDLEFWEHLPRLIEILMRRNQELPLNEGKGMWMCLEEFLSDYIKITLHLICMDTLTLRYLSTEPDLQLPDSMSRNYLCSLAWVLQSSSIPLYRALEHLYGDDLTEFLIRLREKAIAMEVCQIIAEFASVLAENATKCSTWINSLPPLFLTINCILDGSLEWRQNTNGEAGTDAPAESPHVNVLYETICLIDKKYQEWITKKASWLTSELSEQILRQINRSFSHLSMRDNKFVHQLSKSLCIEIPDGTDPKDSFHIISWGWKFRILKKEIMEGRMELRAHGVETMQSELVVVWRQHLSTDPEALSLPFIQYLIRFIQGNKILDYLVGVDSHPQLISRSSNIVGFLIATSTYTTKEIDLIWKTVTESQDSRIVAEVLSMLTRVSWMLQSTSPELLYTCAKVLELPLDRFDTRVIDFCDNFIGRLSEKPKDHMGDVHVDTIPLRLCVRLIRESTAAQDISVEHKKQLQSFGSKHLEGFIKAGISDKDRMELYEQCIQDIADMNQFTAGSIQVLSALVPNQGSHEMRKLAEDFDLTRLVINDLLHAVNSENVDFGDGFSHHGLISRIAILFRLIDMVPDTISPALGKAYWTEILLSKKLGYDGYKAAWRMMVNALSRSSETNPFLERCIHEYLPELSPEDYTPEILSFAKQSITYDVRFNPPRSPANEGEVITIPGMERIWKFILTANSGTIETEATKFAIEVYLDHPIIRSSPRPVVEATHVAIVNRCIDQLKSTAPALRASDSTDDTPMQNGPQSVDTSADELKFRRSLLFLRQFLYGLRTRPHYSPPRGSPPTLPDRPLKGEPIDVSWQSFHGSSHSTVNTLRIGDISTAGEFVERLSRLTGFSKFTTIWGGQRIDLLKDPEALLKDIKVPGLLILRKAADAQEVFRDSKRQSLTPVDSEVHQHLDEIYELLSLKDEVAQEIYDFLLVFPPQQQILDFIRSEDSDEKTLFPLEKPFVAFYSFSALLTSMREQLSEPDPQQRFIVHSIEMLEAFLMNNELIVDTPANTRDDIRLCLTMTSMECLLCALGVYVPKNEESVLFKNADSFADKILSLIGVACSVKPKSFIAVTVQKLICCLFAVTIEGSIRDYKFWEAIKQRAQFDQLMQELLLKENRQVVRNEVSERIKMIASPSKFMKQATKFAGDGLQPPSPKESPVRIDMLATIWSALVQVIPQSLDYASQSSEFFKVVVWVFRIVAEKSPRDVILSQYLKDWSEVMFRHQSDQFVGRETVDDLVLGFAVMLEVCLELADAANIELDTFDLAEQILRIHLFPELSMESIDGPIIPRIPVLHSLTRQRLYNVVNLLCKRSNDNLNLTMRQLEDVVPRDVSYGPNSSYDRSKMIRAPEGYAGLKNLSNTCYLNSLMTQLFMNVEFRDFMLQLDLVDPDSSQRLLDETQKLFAWMQDTWTKSVDPHPFVESIRTYDNEAIDVTVQMDVDEFYNLLFDRWEAQVGDSIDKKKFRSFYGGQLVQQIKSKECSHISERLEPFSAIQCDIKGKACLEESLQAYVEGEIMQGDNKYSCTACNRHVDAVKRACLKDVPDNLIFHLKRFDFDMVTMTRSKINDEFQFPERIDMTPYKVEFLSDPEALVEPDIFELVGVLVHTGTAESGHYYSYTRERPAAGSQSSWVEFNDSDVSRFDASTIAEQCFGGQTESMHSMGGVHVNKVWNAYMLFYQRVSVVDESKQNRQPLTPGRPARIPVPTEFANHIAMDNELFLRTYCLLDPYYTILVNTLLERLRAAGSEYAHRSDLEVLAMEVGLDTFEQLIARTKEYHWSDSIFTELFKLLSRNPQAALQTLKWVSDRSTSLNNIILRTSNSDIRQKGIMLITSSVKRLRTALRDDSGLDETERNYLKVQTERHLQQVVSMIQTLWPSLHAVPRAWDDYFDFIVKLAECGTEVIGILLENCIFARCMEIIWLDHEDKMRLRNSYPSYTRLLEKGRRFGYANMMTLVSIFFKNIDLSLPPVPDTRARQVSSDGMFAPSQTESKYALAVEEDGGSGFLMKMLQHEQYSAHASCFDVFATFMSAEPGARFLDRIVKTLEIGLRLSPADMCAPFLSAAVVYCRFSPDEAEVMNMIDFVAKGVDSINNSGGAEHLEFFKQLCSSDSVNERLNLGPEWFSIVTLQKLPDFVPTLLIDTDKVVRHETIDIANRLLFSGDSDDELAENPNSPRILIGKTLAKACVERVNRSFLSGQIANVPSRLVYPISSTITHCLENYFESSNEEDEAFIIQANDSLNLLEQIATDVPDDLVSESDMPSPEEWEATSALASDSEMGLVGSP